MTILLIASLGAWLAKEMLWVPKVEERRRVSPVVAVGGEALEDAPEQLLAMGLEAI